MKKTICCLVAGVLGLVTSAERVTVTAAAEPSHTVSRSIFGVNQLDYGRNSYDFVDGRGKVNPEMVMILKDIGVKGMRYPGGCGGTHEYNWKVSAGLVPKRRYSLQLMEFLACCETVGAEPILGLSALRGTPEEAAEFVEFLNGPADEAHPWARERARLGHARPYGVKWIEYGNESYDNGGKRGDPNRTMNGRIYGTNYLAFRAAMKTADSSIQLGVVTFGGGGGFWDKAIYDRTGTNLDFIIIHSYANGGPVAPADYRRLFIRQNNLRTLVEERVAACPRSDVPVVVTEFNTTLSSHRTLTAALVNAESLMCFASMPRIVHADYWQFVNEAFGMVWGKPGAYVKRPNALAYELVTRHTLDKWVSADVRFPIPTLAPGAVVLTPEETAQDWYAHSKRGWFHPKKDARFHFQTAPDGSFETEFLTDEPMNFYHASMTFRDIPPGDAWDWKLDAEVRVEGMPETSGFALQLGDARGWNATHSAASSKGVLSSDWIPVSVTYTPLPDMTGLHVQLRRVAGGGRGKAWVRNLKLRRVVRGGSHNAPIAAQVTVANGKDAVACVLVNRTLSEQEVEVDLAALGIAPATFAAEALTGPEPYADNETDPACVKMVPLAVAPRARGFSVMLPPHALAGVRGR